MSADPERRKELNALAHDLSGRVEVTYHDGQALYVCPIGSADAHIDRDGGQEWCDCEHSPADLESALRMQANGLPLRRCSTAERAEFGHRQECLQCQTWQERLRTVTRQIAAEFPASGQHESRIIEVEGLQVRRDEYEKVKTQRLVWRLADRSALEEIEEAEVASMPDKWLHGDAVLGIAAVSPIWGTESSPWTASGQQTLIVGPDSTGKSTLSTHYGKARLNLPGWGGLLLGGPVVPLPEDQSALYLAADRPIQIMEGFKRGLTEDMREQLHTRLSFWPGPPPMDLSTRDLCPACSDAVDAVGAVGPTAMERAVVAHLGLSAKGPVPPVLDGLVGWAGLPGDPPPNAQPWDHCDLSRVVEAVG